MPEKHEDEEDLAELRERLRVTQARLEQVEAERDALHEEVTSWHALVESMPDIVAITEVSPEHRLRYINRPMPARLGTGAFDLLTPESAKKARACFSRLLESGEPQTYEARSRVSVGPGVRCYRVRAAPLRSAGQSPQGIVAVATDVTDEKRTERLLRLMTEQLPAVVWTTDADLNVTLSTGAGLRHAGLEPGQLVGTNVRDVIGDMSDVLEALGRVLQGESSRVEAPWQGRDFEAWFEPLFDADARVVGTIGLALDVSERRALEAQLRQAQKMDAVGRLAGGIAHDFNNLLTAMLGQVKLAQRSEATPARVRQSLDTIRVASERAAELTSRLLTFGRAPSVHPSVLDVGDVLRETERILERLLGESVEMTVELSGAGAVCIDRAQLEQVLLNLVINAREAMPAGGRLRVSVETADASSMAMPRGSADRLVVIRVEDEGEGMDPATQEQIFEPFFTTKDEGSGLGLATVYGIVQQCGGHIEVESALGRGTTFRVLLPESAAAAPRVVERERPTTMCGHETVLVVEDEVLVRSLAKQVLIEAGYTVLEASDGREALEVIEEESRIDLVVTDVVMPRMSGLELAEALREGYPAMPLVFMSGYPHPRRGSGGPRAASVPVLAKPFSTEALLQEVRLVLDSATTVTTTSSDEVE